MIPGSLAMIEAEAAPAGKYNLIPNSVFVGWSAPGSVLSRNAVVAPDSTTTAASVVFTNASSVSQLYVNATDAISGAITLRVWLKAPVATDIRIGFYDPSSGSPVTLESFNISTAWAQYDVNRSAGISASGDRRMCWVFDNSGVDGRTLHLWHPQVTLAANANLPYQETP